MNQTYAMTVFWSDEDQVWIAEAPDLHGCAAHGATPEAAVAELGIAVDAWLQTARDRGMPLPSPRFRATLPAAE